MCFISAVSPECDFRQLGGFFSPATTTEAAELKSHAMKIREEKSGYDLRAAVCIHAEKEHRRCSVCFENTNGEVHRRSCTVSLQI